MFIGVVYFDVFFYSINVGVGKVLVGFKVMAIDDFIGLGDDYEFIGVDFFLVFILKEFFSF